MNEIWITGVASTDARKIWRLVEPMVAEALGHGGELQTTDAILSKVESRDMQLWLVMNGTAANAVFITEIREYPKGMVLTAVVLAGDGMEYWLPAVEGTLVAYAKSFGCCAVKLHGRRGWIRAMASYGWHEQSVNMIKEVVYE